MANSVGLPRRIWLGYQSASSHNLQAHHRSGSLSPRTQRLINGRGCCGRQGRWRERTESLHDCRSCHSKPATQMRSRAGAKKPRVVSQSPARHFVRTAVPTARGGPHTAATILNSKLTDFVHVLCPFGTEPSHLEMWFGGWTRHEPFAGYPAPSFSAKGALLKAPIRDSLLAARPGPDVVTNITHHINHSSQPSYYVRTPSRSSAAAG
jgi:hypothetical protein